MRVLEPTDAQIESYRRDGFLIVEFGAANGMDLSNSLALERLGWQHRLG